MQQRCMICREAWKYQLLSIKYHFRVHCRSLWSFEHFFNTHKLISPAFSLLLSSVWRTAGLISALSEDITPKNCRNEKRCCNISGSGALFTLGMSLRGFNLFLFVIDITSSAHAFSDFQEPLGNCGTLHNLFWNLILLLSFRRNTVRHKSNFAKKK